MNLNTTIPVTITPEAAQHVAQLGMQAELERMLQHTLQTVSGLQSINVVLDEPYDTGDEPAVVIEVWRDPACHSSEDRTQWELGCWQADSFSPDVCRHFTLLLGYGLRHAG
jgi:hypothetical protein